MFLATPAQSANLLNQNLVAPQDLLLADMQTNQLAQTNGQNNVDVLMKRKRGDEDVDNARIYSAETILALMIPEVAALRNLQNHQAILDIDTQKYTGSISVAW
jgi:hypothetical protein